MDIMVVPNISDLTISEYIGSKIYSKFADYNENIIYFMYMSPNDQDQKQIINLNDHENNGHVYFHFTKTIINKKDTSTKILVNKERLIIENLSSGKEHHQNSLFIFL